MRYRNLAMKLDQFVGYVNDGKINLIPPFQRGHVWSITDRRKLMVNIVQGRPIPAIFLYREASGEKFEYNILDGKQRLESLILFIGNERKSLSIKFLNRYFLESLYQKQANFYIDVDGERLTFKDLSDGVVRDLRDYEIPTIEITLDEDNPSALDEIINLFVDINSTGEPVKRFDIVKAMSRDKLLESVRLILARYEERQKDVIYYPRKNAFTYVLKTLQIVANLRDNNSQVDRMWEMLTELVLFLRTKEHKNPVQILKSFINAGKDDAKNKGNAVLDEAELKTLSKPFSFLRSAYMGNPELQKSKLATSQTHFYTMIAALIATDWLDTIPHFVLIQKLSDFIQIVDGEKPIPKGLEDAIQKYREAATRQTTNINRRADRHAHFIEAINKL
jgi:Protein of unknown function DUF262